MISIDSRSVDDRSNDSSIDSRSPRIPHNQVVDASLLLPPPNQNDLPEGWEERMVNGRRQYVNHYEK